MTPYFDSPLLPSLKRAAARGCLFLSVFLVSGCIEGKINDNIDRSLGLSHEDYRTFTDAGSYKKETGEPMVAGEPPIPDLAEILAAPRPPKVGETQMVSVAVTDDIPLKDVLIELARLANVDLDLDANITGGIAFRAKDRPFNEVIERIATLAGLRYSMKNNVLRIERDAPYIEVYSLDFLNMERSSSGNIAINTSVLSSGGSSSGGSSSGSGGGGGRLNSGSSTSITSKSDSDFWKQFDESVKQILTYEPPSRTSLTTVAVQPAVPQLPPAAAPAASEEGVEGEDAITSAQPAAPAPAPAAAVQTTATSSNKPFYILSKQASTLTVSASEYQHDLIKEFIRRIRANAFSQVLLEAKIVEVTLDDQYQGGINWQQLGTSNVSFTGDLGAPTDTTLPNVGVLSVNKNNFLAGLDLDGVVSLVSQFGTTRTLSSPRLHAVNNQEAMLTFAKNQVYFSLTVTSNVSSGGAGGDTTTVTVNSSAHTIPIGIILSMQPSINLDTNEVTLNVRPTLSRVVGNVSDPGIAFNIAQAISGGVDPNDLKDLSSQVPIVEVRELDSILKIKSGQVMVIGGLMEDSDINTDQGIPGVSETPFVGHLFKGVSKAHTVKELVIFIRATIVGSNGNAHQHDQNVYEKFTNDPRPLKF